MSGRSAFVRKEKQKTKAPIAAGVFTQPHHRGPGHMHEYAATPGHDLDFDYELPIRTASSARSVISSEGSGDFAYARARKPYVPSLEVSGIEKSAIRDNIDKKSQGIRKGLLSLGFGGTKKNKRKDQPEAARPPSAGTIRPRHLARDEELPDFNPPRLRAMTKQERQMQEQLGELDSYRSKPPAKRLPALPPAPQLRRWTGNGNPTQSWNKLRKDPELWDPRGDTLVFLSQDLHLTERPLPSFRISSHVLEATESDFFLQMLRDGYIEFAHNPDARQLYHAHDGQSASYREFGNTKRTATSVDSGESGQELDNTPCYELYFPAPNNAPKIEVLRHHVTTRNVFALLYQASLVGLDFSQALLDLQKRLEQYMPLETDCAGLITDFVTARSLDDVRNDPSAAASLLSWSENENVQWQRGWREGFVHCNGMHNKLDAVPEIRQISTFTRALIERASLEVQVRINAVEEILAEFNFVEMWAFLPVTQILQPERAAFDRLRNFIRGYYEGAYGSWPVSRAQESEHWLTRSIVQKLQRDFGVLYDCLVDREVIWDCSEERSGRKWEMKHRDPSKPLSVDTEHLPMTDMLVGFDNRCHYPHIPHPYPLIPQAMPELTKVVPKENFYKASKKQANQAAADLISKRKDALAYTEATNLYNLGSDFKPTTFVDAFLRFEKEDKVGVVKPAVARRGRWVLIYGILQVLGSVSVDTPGLRYTDGVEYHLNPKMRGTPPWKGAKKQPAEGSHENSHCWQVPKKWHNEEEADDYDPPTLPSSGRQSRTGQASVLSLPIESPEVGTARSVTLGGQTKLGPFPIPPSSTMSYIDDDDVDSQRSNISRSRKKKMPANRSSLATSTEADDELPTLEFSRTSHGMRHGQHPIASPIAPSLTESETGSSIRSSALSRRPYRETMKLTDSHDALGVLHGGYGSGIEVIAEPDTDDGDEWSSHVASRLQPSELLAIKDYDDFGF